MHPKSILASLFATRRTLLVAGSVIALAVSAGCLVDSGEDPSAEGVSSADPLTGAFTMVPTQMTVSRGKAGSGQGVSALATKDLTGTQDVWSKYVEYSPNSSATFDYSLPAGVAAADITDLSIGVNYRGPKKAEMRWTFEAWDAAASAWVLVGDNAFAGDWTWSQASLSLPGPLARYVSAGKLKLRYATTSNVDASDVDLLVLVGKAAGGSGSGGAGGSSSVSSSSTTSSTTSSSTTSSSTTSSSSSSGSGGGGGAVWHPAPGTTWQWQLTGSIDTSLNVAMYDIDLFDAPQSTIDKLHAAGRKVICYFSAGSHEDWRPDAASFPAAVLGNPLNGWPGERWLDTRSATVRTLMKARLDLAVTKKCDGVEPDNVDGYTNNPGFPLTASTQLDYNGFLASEAHARSLSVGLKNDLDQVPSLVGSFDWALNESCHKYNECAALTPFISAGKAVFNAEYGSASLANSVCPDAKTRKFSTLIKNLNLDAWVVACP